MIRVHCLIDNTVTRSSPLWGEHGLAFYVETPDGRLLFDTGQSGQVLLHNAAQLDIDLAQVDALALSHAHYDHTGGLGAVLERTRPLIPLYANADLFRERYTMRGEEYVSIGLTLSRDDLARSFAVRLSADPVEMLPGVWTTGEITDRSGFEGRSATHRIRVGDGWEPDPYRDDLALVLETAGGLVVLCGCCHAGLLNTLAHVHRHFKGDIVAVAGGLHLAGITDDMLQLAASLLQTTYGAPRLYPNHCTGEKAYVALAAAFGEGVQPCPAGALIEFP